MDKKNFPNLITRDCDDREIARKYRIFEMIFWFLVNF